MARRAPRTAPRTASRIASPGRRVRRGAVAALAAAWLGAATLAGCPSARNTLGTNSSLCYRALAVARDAVHNKGQFAGVRLVKVAALTHYPPLRPELTARSGTPPLDVCVVSDRGRFRLGQRESAPGTVHAAAAS